MKSTTDYLRQAGLYLGADWNEARAGTNGTGTCIATGEALTVHQSDHFDATHIPLTCTVAPIFDPTGNLSAVLDISALSSPSGEIQPVPGAADRQELRPPDRDGEPHPLPPRATGSSSSPPTRRWRRSTSNMCWCSIPRAASSASTTMAGSCWRRSCAATGATTSLILGRLISDFFDCEVDSLTRFVALQFDRTQCRAAAGLRAEPVHPGGAAREHPRAVHAFGGERGLQASRTAQGRGGRGSRRSRRT